MIVSPGRTMSVNFTFTSTCLPFSMRTILIRPVAPRSLTPPQQVAANAPAKLAAPAAAASGSYMLQIGAFKSQAEAAAAWKTYQGKHAALLSGYSDNVQQADLGEKGTWYRLRIGGFADKEVATALCDRLKADGGACMLGR